MPFKTCTQLIVIVAFLTLISLLPQIYLWTSRGSQWNGAFANLDMDEYAYSAYLKSLIDNHPRRNDPYTRSDSVETETLFSIQFLPAYTLAFLARFFGLSASAVFIILAPVITVASTLAVFWLLSSVTEDNKLAVVGSLGVLVVGTVVAVNPASILIGDRGFDFLPFLRRYLPATVFPFIFGLILFTWKALTRHAAWAIVAGFLFVILIFSYFFLWTAAAAWLFGLCGMWIITHRQKRQGFGVFGIIFGIGLLGFVPYARLIQQRTTSTDTTQVLELTHRPDLLRGPEIYALVLLFLMAYQWRRRGLLLSDSRVVFAGSLLLAPLILFNQQLITGRSLQPFHYEHFVANYFVVLAAFILISVIQSTQSRRLVFYLLAGSLMLATLISIRMIQLTGRLSYRLDVARGAALHLRMNDQSGMVVGSDLLVMDTLPTVTSNPVLWAPHLSAFSGLDPLSQRHRFFQTLYYVGFTEKKFDEALHSTLVARAQIFGAQRADPVLAFSVQPISELEIAEAVSEYKNFIASFDRRRATEPTLAYALVHADDDLNNLDRWYQRKEPTKFGDLILYPVTLKQ
jgi:hypothetical protein